MDTSHSSSQSAIAIIGMSGRFPGARNVDEFWRNLCDGVESITRFSREELETAGVNRTLLDNPNYVRAAAVLQDIDLFDAAFFGFTPREAEITDPQQRLFLECAWEALESSGYTSESYGGRIGVYAGVSAGSYFMNLLSRRNFTEAVERFQLAIGNDKDYLCTRTSYKLNLRGPSVTVQSACSTSLVAVHLACQSLLYGECDMALAGGATITTLQPQGYLYEEGMIISPDGHCRAFDARAQGTIFGDGVGIVVLKRLEDALADRDSIKAVIRGSAINNDGALKIGFTAPGLEGQASVIAEALAVAGVEPERISYVEMHGTGTPLGDPIEIAAITKVFRGSTKKKGFCAIGSVKTNIGHLDITAGVAGLIKTVLVLEHKQLPPSLHFEESNPTIDFPESPFFVNTKLKEWVNDKGPRYAAVSSFGIGGTNSHVVLEEAPLVEASDDGGPWQLLLLSATTGSALESATRNLAEYLRQNREVKLADVAYTLQVGRTAFNYRRILLGREIEDTVITLASHDPSQIISSCEESRARPVVFMFPGQGAQHINMGRELYESEPTFREQVNHCSELLGPRLGLDLRQVLYPRAGDEEAAALQLDQTAITQPALFVIEYALAKLWMAWGVRPKAMIGHSIGEYVAACLSGVLTLEDALELVALRGRLIQQQPEGAMLGVALGEESLRPLMNGQLAIAALNSPTLSTVSGTVPAIDALQSQFVEQGMKCWRLNTSHAFHSSMMEPILEPFAGELRKANLGVPQIPYVSNVTGTWVTAAEVKDPDYWADHLVNPVRFAAGLQELLKDPDGILLEVGPGKTLTTLAKRHPDKVATQVILSSLRHPREPVSDVAHTLKTLGQLWLAGLPIDWPGFHANRRRRRLPLPTYPFERQRYWIERKEGVETLSESFLSTQPDGVVRFSVPSWKRSILLPSPLTGAHQRYCWLVLVDECGLGLRLAERLEQEGHEVIMVSHGPRFERRSERTYTVNPVADHDYENLFAELHAQDRDPQKIIHLWSVTENGSGIDAIDQTQDLGFHSLLSLVRICGPRKVASEFYIVSNNVQEVTGEETLSPSKTTLLGAVRVIPQEYPHISCRSMDVVISESGTPNSQTIDQLLTELNTESGDVIVAYRGNHRWVQIFEPVRLDKPSGSLPRLRERGTYLITGGLGGIGLVLAEHLAKSVRARLILTGRSTFPAKTDWENWLTTYGEDDPLSRKIRKVQELEALGAEVLVFSEDVAEQERMQAVIVEAEARFGRVNGVIHAAGVFCPNMIQQKTREEIASTLRPKVKGTLVLDEIFRDKELDFWILCSSKASFLGGFGQVDYCAACAFLDAYAHIHFCKKRRFTVSINWDVWRETGMATEMPVPPQIGITPAAGVDAFDRILASALSQVVISTETFATLVERNQAFRETRLQEASQRAGSPELIHQRPELKDAYLAPRNEIERRIAGIWQEVLGIAQVGINDNFFALGADSLMATQFISRLQDAFPLKLPLQRIFTAPTIAELAEVIEELMTEKLEELPEDEAQDLIAKMSER